MIDAEGALLLVVDVQERLLPAMSEPAVIERNCSVLMESAQQLGVPMLLSEQYPKGLGHTIPSLAANAPEGSTFAKVDFSCCRDAAIMKEIENFSRKQAILCGVESHVCVLQTALDLQQRGFDVFVAIDATGSRSEESKQIARDRMVAAGVTVVTTEMVVFELLKTAASPQFKALSRLIQ